MCHVCSQCLTSCLSRPTQDDHTQTVTDLTTKTCSADHWVYVVFAVTGYELFSQ